ncbi:MAG: protein-(glutamine-N5) methyltransferase, release factor-specific [Pseudonocardiales bacterium]|nr:protein-(glutamine-N5) methyltransferase, release factor-specific [Pseudonocardiales bacterium]
MTGPASIRELLSGATDRLAAAGVESARVDAELLLSSALNVDRGRLIIAAGPTPAESERFEALIQRRINREPLQHILGNAAFRHLLLAVGPGVFVPRPETELLVDAVLPTLKSVAVPTAVDLCSGSGALALSIATEVPTAGVTAIERSAAALIWLQRNIAEVGVGDRVRAVQADVADPQLLTELNDLLGSVDVVVANPPYVPAAVEVGPEVGHDPAEAVFAGDDGLDLIADVVRIAAALLRPGGMLAMEHDDTHAESVPALLGSTGTDLWADVVDHPDLAGRPRYVTATRR